MYLRQLLTTGMLASALPGTLSHVVNKATKIRTVVTTDMESDDLASLVRYILYANDLENQGLIYTSSKFHWEGDGKNTSFFLPDREYNTSQTSWRPTGTTTIEDHLLKAYAEVYPNLRVHDPTYPPPSHLLSITAIGNVDFDGEMAKDTPGSNLIKSLILDSDPRTLYLQAWGGTNTIARALKSISDTHSADRDWNSTKAAISTKVVVLASGFQDNTYEEYIAPHWPEVRVEDLSAAYDTWGFNCNDGRGNVRGLPDNNIYYQGNWTKKYIQTGPLGSLYRSWLDGQTTFGGGDQLDVFGDPARAPGGWCKPMAKYDFLSEGDNVVFNPLLPTGLQEPSDANIGGWGGRRVQNSTSPDLWVLVDKEIGRNGSQAQGWTTDRWVEAAQNDFAARIQWTLTGAYGEGNHAPVVKIKGPKKVKARASEVVKLVAKTSDPDGDRVEVKWWQYREEGTYAGAVSVEGAHDGATVRVPSDAKKGETISVIAQATDDGAIPLTRYDRVFIVVA
ncbi:cellulose-binding protein [Stagonosporopsis vannaccii]|nr:cellulose-binding protein [Stagonosporopsis vannaccii]